MKIACTLIQKYINKNHKIITFDLNGRKTSMQLSDIIYLESFLHEITIHAPFNDYKYSSTFNKMMSLINSTNIIRIQKSYAVNLFWVKEIYKEELLLRNGVTLKIGKKYQQDVIASYKEVFIKMMYFFLDYLEVLLGSLLIRVFCDIEDKKRFCLITSIINFFIMQFLQKYNLFGNVLVYAIGIISFIFVSLMKKKFVLFNFILCILPSWISVFTSTCVILLIKIVSHLSVVEIMEPIK